MPPEEDTLVIVGDADDAADVLNAVEEETEPDVSVDAAPVVNVNVTDVTADEDEPEEPEDSPDTLALITLAAEVGQLRADVGALAVRMDELTVTAAEPEPEEVETVVVDEDGEPIEEEERIVPASSKVNWFFRPLSEWRRK